MTSIVVDQLTESRVNIGGVETQLLSLSGARERVALTLPDASCAARKRRRQMIVIVPGNPGVGDFYRDFARLLYRQSDEADDVVIVSHAGHCGRATFGGRAFSLEEQVAHKLHLIDTLCGVNNETALADAGLDAASEDEPIVLMGHSIGALINLRVVSQVCVSSVVGEPLN